MNRLPYPNRARESFIVGAFVVVSVLIQSALQQVGNMWHNNIGNLPMKRCVKECQINDTQCINKCKIGPPNTFKSFL